MARPPRSEPTWWLCRRRHNVRNTAGALALYGLQAASIHRVHHTTDPPVDSRSDLVRLRGEDVLVGELVGELF